jgi:hypothetical protein
VVDDVVEGAGDVVGDVVEPAVVVVGDVVEPTVVVVGDVVDVRTWVEAVVGAEVDVVIVGSEHAAAKRRTVTIIAMSRPVIIERRMAPP